LPSRDYIFAKRNFWNDGGGKKNQQKFYFVRFVFLGATAFADFEDGGGGVPSIFFSASSNLKPRVETLFAEPMRQLNHKTP